jgi:hypothetical protein
VFGLLGEGEEDGFVMGWKGGYVWKMMIEVVYVVCRSLLKSYR